MDAHTQQSRQPAGCPPRQTDGRPPRAPGPGTAAAQTGVPRPGTTSAGTAPSAVAVTPEGKVRVIPAAGRTSGSGPGSGADRVLAPGSNPDPGLGTSPGPGPGPGTSSDPGPGPGSNSGPDPNPGLECRSAPGAAAGTVGAGVVATVALPPGTEPVAIALADEGRAARVTDGAGDVALVIDTATNTLLHTVAAGTAPYGFAVAPGGGIQVFDHATGEVRALAVPGVPGVTPATGPSTGGTAITITGSGFTGATDVTVAGVPAASVTVDGDTSVTAVTAPGTGTGPVIVTTAEGSGTSAGVFAYVFTPTSTMTSLEVIPSPAACGEDVALRATVLTAAGDAVTTGAVTFLLGDAGPARTVALDTSGQAGAVFSGLGPGGRQAAAFFVPAGPGTAASNSPLTPVTVDPLATPAPRTAVSRGP